MNLPISKLNVIVRIVIRLFQIIVNVDKSKKKSESGDINDLNKNEYEHDKTSDHQQTA